MFLILGERLKMLISKNGDNFKIIGKCFTKSRTKVIVECYCGKPFITRKDFILSGHTNSCGCYAIKRATESNVSHGMTESMEYSVWMNMKDRCYRSKNPHYKNYGGRGIQVCDSWRNSFEQFFKDMGFCPSKNHSIDRINNNGNYEKENCKWSDRKEQSRNRRSNHIVEFDGKQYSVVEFNELIGGNYTATLAKLKRGWSTNKIVTDWLKGK